jgi:hypothetical protein
MLRDFVANFQSLIRRSDCQSAQCQQLSNDVDLDTRWRAEVDAEERRRYKPRT